VTLEFEGFHLVDGVYQEIPLNEQGQRWSQQLGLYLGIHNRELRFFTPEGQLVQTPEEVAAIAQATATAERQRNDRLAAKLRELGVNPDEL
jgi:hypothetical protein